MPEPPKAAVRRHNLDDAVPDRAASSQRSAALTVVLPADQRPGAKRQKPQDFTAADKALIRRVHAYMSPLQLLGILNTRLTTDLGDTVAPYTIDQLRAEIASVTTPVPATGNDWTTLRKLLAKARREGVLACINEAVINDFAVVFSVSQKQLMLLKEILLAENGGEE